MSSCHSLKDFLPRLPPFLPDSEDVDEKDVPPLPLPSNDDSEPELADEHEEERLRRLDKCIGWMRAERVVFPAVALIFLVYLRSHVSQESWSQLYGSIWSQLTTRCVCGFVGLKPRELKKHPKLNGWCGRELYETNND